MAHRPMKPVALLASLALAFAVQPALAREACPRSRPPMATPPGFDEDAYQAVLKQDMRAMISQAVAYLEAPEAERAPGPAIDLFCRAAGAGHPYAMYELSIASTTGVGAPVDKVEAFRWMLASAKRDYPLAIAQLGRMYTVGYGARRDPKAAARWLKRGVEAGEPWAMLYLADLYESGQGVSRDSATADRLRKVAIGVGGDKFIAEMVEQGRTAPDWAPPPRSTTPP